MPYIFTDSEKTQIEQAIADCSGLEQQPDGSVTAVPASGTNAKPFYSTLSAIVTNKINSGLLEGTELIDAKSAKLWLDVAIGTNSGIGMHSAFIRKYTNFQGQLRLGREFTDAEMQLASNAVAVATTP